MSQPLNRDISLVITVSIPTGLLLGLALLGLRFHRVVLVLFGLALPVLLVR